MIADVAAEYFDGPLQPDSRKLADRPHRTPAFFTTGSVLVMYLANSRGHHLASCNDELAYSVKAGPVKLLLAE